MPAVRVIEAVDVLKDGVFGLAAGFPCPAPDQLGPDDLEERLDNGAVIAIGRREELEGRHHHARRARQRPVVDHLAGRRKLFKLAEVHHMPLAIEAVRQRDIAPLVAAIKAWMHAEWAKLSRNDDLAQAMDYMLKRGLREPRQ